MGGCAHRVALKPLLELSEGVRVHPIAFHRTDVRKVSGANATANQHGDGYHA